MKLSLKRETLRVLDESQLARIDGGKVVISGDPTKFTLEMSYCPLEPCDTSQWSHCDPEP